MMEVVLSQWINHKNKTKTKKYVHDETALESLLGAEKFCWRRMVIKNEYDVGAMIKLKDSSLLRIFPTLDFPINKGICGIFLP